MKSELKRIERATADVVKCLQKELADIRAAVMNKHQLTGLLLDYAVYVALGEVAKPYEKLGDKLNAAAEERWQAVEPAQQTEAT